MLVANKKIWVSGTSNDMIELHAISGFQNGGCLVDGFFFSISPEEINELKQIWIDYIENLEN